MNRSSLPSAYYKIFEEQCPVYMAMGMTYEQFWDGDPEMVKAYRKAYELRRKVENQRAWLQGMYFYDAICRTAPILRAFSKAKKPQPYPTEPYSVEAPTEQRERESRLSDNDERARVSMEIFAIKFNKQFKKKEASKNAER